MEYRTLGRTGLEVSVLSLGGLFVSKVGGDRAQAFAAIHRALELGVNYVDTAPGYLDSEEVLGEGLEGVTQPYIISTKLGGRPEPFDARDVDGLKFSFAESLRLLKRDSVDILMIHEPDRPGQHDWWSNWEDFTGPVTEVLAELRTEGLVRFTGLGGTTPYVLARICATGQFDVVLTAFNYSLLWREAGIAVIPEATRQKMGIAIGSPLQQGWLSRRFDAEVRRDPAWLSPQRREQFLALYALVDELGMPLTDLALRWVISDPRISTTLMGARSVAEVEMNVAAVGAGPLPESAMSRLAEIGAMVPTRPSNEPFGCPFYNPAYRGPGHAAS
jgi:aryl-alcohol dehydrogenase-like predicted oxidoreductase